MEAAGMNGRQGTSRSKELDGKDSIERLGGETCFYLHSSNRSQNSPSDRLQMWYYTGFKGARVLRTVLEYLVNSFFSASRIYTLTNQIIIERNLHR